MPSFFISAIRLERLSCWSCCNRPTSSSIWSSCCSGVRPSALRVTMPSRTWPARPATRTMKNSSRLSAEIDRKRTPLQQGVARVLRFLQHAAVELQPGEFAVDEAIGIARHGLAFRRRLAPEFGLDRLQLIHFAPYSIHTAKAPRSIPLTGFYDKLISSVLHRTGICYKRKRRRGTRGGEVFDGDDDGWTFDPAFPE